MWRSISRSIFIVDLKMSESSPDCLPVQGGVGGCSVHQLGDRVGVLAPPVQRHPVVVVQRRDGDRSLRRPAILLLLKL